MSRFMEHIIDFDESQLKIPRDNNINNNNQNNNQVNNTNNGSGSNSKEKHFKNNISPKWYDNYNNKKIGYVFDKEKVITCEDDDNGAK